MPLFTRETAQANREKAMAARRANIERRKQAAALIPQTPADAHECNVRLWEIIAAIDKRLLHEAAKPRPTSGLMRDLAAVRKVLLSQANGHEPVKADEPTRAAAPVLAEPVPVQE